MTDSFAPGENSNSEVRSAGASTCPHCGNSGIQLNRIETGMRLRLQEEGSIQPVPEAVCDDCLRGFTRLISKGAALRAEAQAKEQYKINLWKNRVNFVKQAKQLMATRQLSDAAVAYEKYLRIVELVFEKGSGELSPELFTHARAQELTVVTSVYWDLLRIYDAHQKYEDRQLQAATKLAEFARFTPVFPDIARKAESQVKTARNPAAFKHFLKQANLKRSRCFIATSAFGSLDEPYNLLSSNSDAFAVIHTLVSFRDQFLKKYRLGKMMITLYERISPPIAKFLDAHPSYKPGIRQFLTLLAHTIDVFFEKKS